MPRHAKPSDLSLRQPLNGPEGGIQPGPNSSPMNLQGVDLGSFGGGFEHDVAAGLTPMPALPQSPPGSPRTAQPREPSKSLLQNITKRTSPDAAQKQHSKDSRKRSDEEEDGRPGTSSVSRIYHLRRNGSTPELSLLGSRDNIHKDAADGSDPAPPLPVPRPQPTPHHSEDSTTTKRRDRIPGFKRTKSLRRPSDSKQSRPRVNGKDSLEQEAAPPNTAPSQPDWPGTDSRMLGSNGDKGKGRKDTREKSAERHVYTGSEENLSQPKTSKDYREGIKKGSMNMIGKATSGGGRFLKGLGKLGRSGSSTAKDIPDSEYVPKVINLPLVEQTRLTRISKRLSGCRDKTEYWMPSLPWRCIDYLNTNAEEEGLYRIPGSGPQVKHWQRRFDTELDIDLLSEEVRDTNEIASMLKAWLRELPTEIMPQDLQKALAIKLEQENPKYRNVGESASQLLRDCLSELPPFNYYLLFAITCHLSLLLTNRERNKMDLNNLAVCVGPCLNLERWLFNYLVGDWRHCWQGCYTEKEYLKREEEYEQGIVSSAEPQHPELGADERALSSNLWAASLNDNETHSEAVSIQSVTDDRAISSGSGSNVSKPASSYDDAHSTSRERSQRKLDNIQTYMPQGARVFSNGTIGLGIDQEVKRPRTAEQRNAPEAGVMTGQQPGTNKDRSNSTTPKVAGHNRSRSDLPVTPVKATPNPDWGYPIRPT